MKQRVRIIRSLSRSYGYTIQYLDSVPSYVVGPQGTAGWYRLKRDAVNRATECGFEVVN
jgi:hypothetical protein